MTKISSNVKPPNKYENLRKEIEAGRATTYYINKNGEIIQKVTVHLPIEMVTRLKKEAINQRITLSELIRRRLG